MKAGVKEVRKGVETGDGPGAAEKFFKEAIKAAPESEEGATARVWLARIELERAPTSDTNKAKAIRCELQSHFKPDDSSWQAKVFKVIEVSALMLERDWEEFDRATSAMLKDIRKYSDETNPNYCEYFAVNGEKAAELEPQLSFLLVIASSVQGDLLKALKQAKEIKVRFPEWSTREGVDTAIEILEKGESPFNR